jgi:tetratricopeptide (TPR) repeat protein
LILVVCVAGCAFAPASAQSATERVQKLYDKARADYANANFRYRALEELDEALKIAPDNADCLTLKAHALLKAEEDEEALVCANKALKINANSADAWDVRSQIALRGGQFLDALSFADRAVKLSNNQVLYRANRARVLTKMHRFADAMRETDAIVKQYPDDLVGRALHAGLAGHEKRWADVVKDQTVMIEKGVKNTGTYGLHYQARADAYLNLKQYKKAVADLETAQKILPMNREIQTSLLHVYEFLRDARGAEKQKKLIEQLDRDIQP